MEKADELLGLYVARGLKPEPVPQTGHSVAHLSGSGCLGGDSKGADSESLGPRLGRSMDSHYQQIHHTETYQRRADMTS